MAPNFHRVCGYLLNKWVDDVRKLVDGYRIVWKQIGCTLMADGWTDCCRRTFINFLVYCPKGTVFLRYVDASHVSKSAEMLHKLFREKVLLVGPENVVHIVTNSAENYVAAGRLLEVDFSKLYWSPCATQCINLMLDDIGKLEEVSGRDILRPAPTLSATNFIVLQNILAHKDALRAMVTSRDWTSSAYAKESRAKKFAEQILDSRFWKKCVDIVKLMESLVCVLYIVDGKDKPAMDCFCQAMYKAKEEMIMRIFKNAELDFGRLVATHEWNTVMPDEWWESYGCSASNFASSCERNWSIFEHIHSNKRNRLEHQKLNDIIYVRYNLRLQQRILEESPPFLTNKEVEALHNDLANMSIQPISDDIDGAQDNTMDNDDDAQENTMQNVNIFSFLVNEEKPPVDPTSAP
ncbi:hypothetical protein HKD37_18G050770 [Glycine soja]